MARCYCNLQFQLMVCSLVTQLSSALANRWQVSGNISDIVMRSLIFDLLRRMKIIMAPKKSRHCSDYFSFHKAYCKAAHFGPEPQHGEAVIGAYSYGLQAVGV